MQPENDKSQSDFITNGEKPIHKQLDSEVKDAMLAAIVNSSDDAIISKTLDSIITSWNNGAQKLYGYSAEEMIGQSITKLIPHDHLFEEADIITKIRSGETVNHYQTKRITKSGNIIDISLTISPIRNSEGKIIGASKIARNITEQKKTEEQLRIAQQQLELTIENIPAAVYLLDGNGQVIFLNKHALTNLKSILNDQYSPDDTLEAMMKKAVSHVSYENEDGSPLLPEHMPMRKVMQSGKESTLTIKRINKKDGRVEWFHNKVTPLLNDDGTIRFYLLTSSDVTDQKIFTERLEKEVKQRTIELTQSEEKFNKLFVSSPLSLTLSEIPSGIIVEANNTFLETVGYTRDECIGKTSLDLNLIDNNDRQKILDQLLKKWFCKKYRSGSNT